MVLRKPDLSLLLEGNDGFTDTWGDFRRPDSFKKARSGIGTSLLHKMLPEPCGDNRMAVCELRLLDLLKSCTDIFRQGPIDGYTHYLVGWMSKALDKSCTDVFERTVDSYMRHSLDWMSKAHEVRIGFAFSME